MYVEINDIQGDYHVKDCAWPYVFSHLLVIPLVHYSFTDAGVKDRKQNC